MPNAYKLMSFDRNINGNRDVKILECDYLSVQRCVKFTLADGVGINAKLSSYKSFSPIVLCDTIGSLTRSSPATRAASQNNPPIKKFCLYISAFIILSVPKNRQVFTPVFDLFQIGS